MVLMKFPGLFELCSAVVVVYMREFNRNLMMSEDCDRLVLLMHKARDCSQDRERKPANAQ